MGRLQSLVFAASLGLHAVEAAPQNFARGHNATISSYQPGPPPPTSSVAVSTSSAVSPYYSVHVEHTATSLAEPPISSATVVLSSKPAPYTEHRGGTLDTPTTTYVNPDQSTGSLVATSSVDLIPPSPRVESSASTLDAPPPSSTSTHYTLSYILLTAHLEPTDPGSLDLPPTDTRTSDLPTFTPHVESPGETLDTPTSTTSPKIYFSVFTERPNTNGLILPNSTPTVAASPITEHSAPGGLILPPGVTTPISIAAPTSLVVTVPLENAGTTIMGADGRPSQTVETIVISPVTVQAGKQSASPSNGHVITTTNGNDILTITVPAEDGDSTSSAQDQSSGASDKPSTTTPVSAVSSTAPSATKKSDGAAVGLTLPGSALSLLGLVMAFL